MSKVKRDIINIDEDKCNGCGECIISCPEGALKVVDTPNGPKARLVKENFCDGLGACLKGCPQGALTVTHGTVDEYDEDGVIKHIKKTAPGKLDQHMAHLKAHEKQMKGVTAKAQPCGCPGSAAASWKEENKSGEACARSPEVSGASQLRQWPVQLTLVSPQAEYFKGADLLIAADCVPFSFAGFHSEFLKGKALVMGCPKLDDVESYGEKLTQIFKLNDIKSVTVVHMEVPCCFGLESLVKQAIADSGKRIPFCKAVISIKGEIK